MTNNIELNNCKEVICPLCKRELHQLSDRSGALCPNGHFGTNVGYISEKLQ